jgi:DNA-directed RNA polymerase III subunit RPC1
MNHGFSIGISDVTPSPDLLRQKHELITKGYDEATKFIQQAKAGQMQADPGASLEATLEGKLSKVLSDLREKAGSQCIDDLTENYKTNSPLIMTLCGSKGSKINIAQMISCVGQQTVSGSRYVHLDVCSSRLLLSLMHDACSVFRRASSTVRCLTSTSRPANPPPRVSFPTVSTAA